MFTLVVVLVVVVLGAFALLNAPGLRRGRSGRTVTIVERDAPRVVEREVVVEREAPTVVEREYDV